MRTRGAIAIYVLAAAVLLAAPGCDGWSLRSRDGDAARDPLTLKPMPGEADPAEPLLYQVQIVRLEHRLRPDAAVEDVWGLLGTAHVPHEKHALWRANDLRLGEGGDLAGQHLRGLLTETPDRTIRASTLMVRENMDFVIELGRPRTNFDVVWADADGRLGGRHFDEGTVQFRFVCRRWPGDPRAVCVALAPEVAFGPQRMRYERTEHGFTGRMRPEIVTVQGLEAEVRLDPGRILLVGAARSSDLSVGGVFFFERRGPDRWQETLLLAVRPAGAGATPPDAAPAPAGDAER
jgi:hypothetical protein